MDPDADAGLRAPLLHAADDDASAAAAASTVALSDDLTGCKLQASCFLSDGSSGSRGRSVVQKKLLAACILCFIFMIVEVIGGFFAHSVAIMSDAAHMLSDVSSFLVALFAAWAAQQPGTAAYSFGYHRAEIMGALVSVLIIWLVTGALVFEAVQRVLTPVPVNGKLMFIVSGTGVVFNLMVALVLGHAHSPLGDHAGCSHGHSHHHHSHSHSSHHHSDPHAHTASGGCCGSHSHSHPHDPQQPGGSDDHCGLGNHPGHQHSQQLPPAPPAAVAITICPTVPASPLSHGSSCKQKQARRAKQAHKQQELQDAQQGVLQRDAVAEGGTATSSGAAAAEAAAEDPEAALFQPPPMLQSQRGCCGNHGAPAVAAGRSSSDASSCCSGGGGGGGGGSGSGYASGSSSEGEEEPAAAADSSCGGCGHAHAHAQAAGHSQKHGHEHGAGCSGGAEEAAAEGSSGNGDVGGLPLPSTSIHRFDGGCHGDGHSHGHGGTNHGHAHGSCGHGHSYGHGHRHGHDAGHGHENINLRGAVLHVIGDLLQSIGVAIAGLLIWIHQDDPRWYLADPLCTFGFSVLVLLTTRAILRDIFHVLMERAPPRLDLPRLSRHLRGLPGVQDVHDLHVWTLSMGLPVLTAHVHIVEGADASRLLRAFDALCAEQGIRHTTLQICNPGVQLSPSPSGRLTDSSACRSD